MPFASSDVGSEVTQDKKTTPKMSSAYDSFPRQPQCYDRKFLSLYGKLPATPLMLQEDLEQLKARENRASETKRGRPECPVSLALLRLAACIPHRRLTSRRTHHLSAQVLEHGYKIKVVEVDHSAHGVDEPEDVASIERIMAKLGLK